VHTLVDVVARDRRSNSPALFTPAREMDYRRFCTTAWKASNYLRHLGVGGDRGVVILAEPSASPILTFFGAALLGTPTRFVGAVADLPAAVDTMSARAVLVPASAESVVNPPAGTTLVVHGGAPDAATTDHWEAGVWSENPAFPPTDIDSETTLLRSADCELSHGDALAGAETVVDRVGLGTDSRVVLRESLAEPRAVVAGLLAPLVIGATAVGVPLEPGPDTRERGDVAVTAGDAPERTTISPAAITDVSD